MLEFKAVSTLPLGEELDWKPLKAPERLSLRGSHVLVRPVHADDAAPLFAVSHPPDGDPAIWTDDRWPAIRLGFRKWLAPENMDGEGRQIRPLGTLIDEAGRQVL
ncbi:MAG: hypothetical protein ACLPUT_06295 [Solirubrobacteraceae bacterium]